MNEEQRKQVLNTLLGSRGSSRAASEDTGSGEKETETITYHDGIGVVSSETITIQEDDDHEENGKTSPYLKIKIRKTPSAHMPTRGSRGAAGLDLYADTQKPVHIWPGETVSIDTGITMAIPEGLFGAVYPRSGIATKRGLRLSNCVGVIDSDYRGHIIVPLYNDTEKVQIIAPYERIAQIIIQPYIYCQLQQVESLDETFRGSGGFGSTGRK